MGVGGTVKVECSGATRCGLFAVSPALSAEKQNSDTCRMRGPKQKKSSHLHFYLDSRCADTHNPRMVKEVNPHDVLTAFVAKYPTQRKAAEVLGVSQAFLSDMLLKRRDVSGRVLDFFQLKRVVVRVSKGRAA